MSAPPMTATLEQFLAARIDDIVLGNVANQGDRVFEPEQAQKAIDSLMCNAGFYGRIWHHLWSASQTYPFSVDHATYDAVFAAVWWQRYDRPELLADAQTRLHFAKEIRIAAEEARAAWIEARFRESERERAAQQRLNELHAAQEQERQRVKAERAERQAQEIARLTEAARLYDLRQAELKKIRKRDDRNLDKAFGPDSAELKYLGPSEITKEHKRLLLGLVGRQQQTVLIERDNRLNNSAIQQSSLIFPALIEQLSPTLPFHELEECSTNPYTRYAGGSRDYRRWLKKTKGEDYANA